MAGGLVARAVPGPFLKGLSPTLHPYYIINLAVTQVRGASMDLTIPEPFEITHIMQVVMFVQLLACIWMAFLMKKPRKR
jgi:hypothetical protein